MNYQVIVWDQGWDCIQKGITKLKRIVQGLSEPQFNSEEYMRLYTTIYNMCTQKPPHNYSDKLYEKYRETVEEYLTSTVLPSLRQKHDQFLLHEFVKFWENHKVMIRWLSRFFQSLDDCYTTRNQSSFPGLNEVGFNCFRNLVCQEVNPHVRFVVLGLITKEREGEQIDRALMKKVIDIFVEIGMGEMDAYEKDFEGYMLNDTHNYYSRKASRWILEDTYTNYMLKAEECLRRERDRSSHYLDPWSEMKLVEIVKHSLFVVYATQLVEKRLCESGCGPLLAADNVEELSGKFIANLILEQQVPAEGSASAMQE